MSQSILINQEFRSLIPPLEYGELNTLEKSILKEGVRDAIVTWNGYIVDGHNRFDIITKHNITDYRVVEKSFEDINEAKIWIINNQFGRRNLVAYQRVVLALKLEELIAGKAKVNQGTRTDIQEIFPKSLKPIDTGKEVAKVAHVSDRTLDKVKFIEAQATSEQKADLISGDKTIHAVYTSIKRDEIKEQIKQTPVWPTGKYRVIYADPPWKYGNTMPQDFVEQADHYPLMTVDEIIKECPVQDITLDNSILFLWATSPILEDSFNVINAWGFKYKACFVWDKVKHVMGHYNSVRHEFLLIAVKGSCQPDNIELFDSVQTIERKGHSEKPEEFRKIIDTLYPFGPRIELFSRKKVDGWEVYGNQV